MIDVTTAILEINPNAEVSVINNNVDKITWLNGTTPIPVADIEAKINDMTNKLEKSQYVQQRKNAYPEIGDQLDMLWHSIDQNPKLKSEYFEFYEAIKAVKIKYPK
tara:strand:+ start:367 stop:684 length:318 start_codon:yes stop_codon:yes gene_type:complete